MFYHSVCKSQVYADLSNHFQIISLFSTGINVMVATRGDVVNRQSVSDAKYFCPQCQQNIPTSEIMSRCMECGDEIPLLSLWKGTPGGIILCTQCKNSDDYKQKEFKSLSKMSSKISTKNL